MNMMYGMSPTNPKIPGLLQDITNSEPDAFVKDAGKLDTASLEVAIVRLEAEIIKLTIAVKELADQKKEKSKNKAERKKGKIHG